MAYQRQNFKRGQVLTAEQMGKIDEGLAGACEEVERLKNNITNLESLLRTIQEKLNSDSSSVDTVTVNEINEMIVEYFENKTVSEVEA